MRLMGLMPIHQKPNIGRPAKGHKIYPYLLRGLRGLRVGRPDQVAPTSLICRCGTASCIPSPSWTGTPAKVPAWRMSNTLEADFCVEALKKAVCRFGPPCIMNTDQGSRFTSFAWTDRLKRIGTRISMDGKGRFLDNIFVERLWRSLKYGCVYLHAWETGSQARTGIGKWMNFYNRKRPHSALGGQPPAVVYWQRIEQQKPGQQVPGVD